MSKNISDIIVITDLDNTLLTAKGGIPLYNVDMIEKFQRLGGKFTVATGRNVEAVKVLLSQISLNAPAITYNGGVLYDYRHNRILSKKILPESAKEVLKTVMHYFPKVGCEVMADNFRTYLINANDYTYNHLTDEKLSYVVTDIDSVKNGWIKILFADRQQNLLKMRDFCKTLKCDDLDFIMTADTYFEIMPKGVSKGAALYDLCKRCGIPKNNTIVVGDYYNDIEILQNAGLSVCVANAPDEIKNICQIVVPSCTDGGVGHLLAQLIENFS